MSRLFGKRKTCAGSVFGPAKGVSLPEEIIREEILFRLPLESLVRFKSVNKLWKSLISDPEFAQSHLTNISLNPDKDEYLIVNTSNNIYETPRGSVNDPYYYISIISRDNLSEYRINKVPYPLTSRYIHLIGSINGLVCILCLSVLDYQFIIWNPALRRYKKISPLKSFLNNLGYYQSCLFAFGWESMPNDYKLIVKLPNTLQCGIYSTKTESWTEILVSKQYLNLNFARVHNPSTIVKGCPYWSWGMQWILKFDVEKNDFRFIQFSNANDCHKLSYKVINLNDYLARMECRGGRQVSIYCLNDEFQIWTRMYSVNFPAYQWPSMCFRLGGEIVIDKKKYLYDHRSKQIKNIVYDEEGCFINGFSYTPSLVLIKGMKALRGRGPLFRAS